MADEMMRIAGRGVDGTAKPLATFNDGTLKLKNINNYRNLLVTNIDALEPGDQITLIDVESPVIIDYFDWLPRHETDAKIEISSLWTMSIGGNNMIYHLNPQNLLQSKSIHFNIVEYDRTVTPDPRFRFQNKKEMYFPQGLKITLYNTSSDKTFRNSCVLRGRRFDL